MKRVALILLGLGLVGGVILGLTKSSTLFASQVVLTPRVYLPLQERQLSAENPPQGIFGVSDSPNFVVWNSVQSINMLKSAGITMNRTSVDWATLEPTHTTPDQYHWAALDRALNPLLAQHIEPFVMILNTPKWASATNCGPLYDNTTMAELVGALVARYPTIRYWALYNEVDGNVYSVYHDSSGGCFGEPDLDGNGVPDYADYAEMLRLSWKAMHNANPNAQLVMATLAYDNFKPGVGTSPPNYPGGCCFNYSFFDNLMEYMDTHKLPEGDKYTDDLGFNNYLIYDIGYWERVYPKAVGVGAKVAALQEVMANHHQNFPMVITELSSWSTFPSPEGQPPIAQARSLAQMFAEAAFYGVKATMWWTWSDYPPTNCNLPVKCNLFTYGMVDDHLTPKMSYYAYQTLISELRGYTPTTAVVNAKRANLGFKNGKSDKHVLFARTNTLTDATVKFHFDVPQLRVVDMLGKATLYQADATGGIDLNVTANPVYVELNP